MNSNPLEVRCPVCAEVFRVDCGYPEAIRMREHIINSHPVEFYAWLLREERYDEAAEVAARLPSSYCGQPAPCGK